MLSIRSSFAVAALCLAVTAAVTALAAAPGCGTPPQGVEVNCVVTSEEMVECDVEQTKGTAEIEACWDFKVVCGNGEEVTAPRTCQKVKGGGTEKATIPISSMTNVDKCGGDNPSAVLSNLTINGKKAQ